jgi:hypothetical protein
MADSGNATDAGGPPTGGDPAAALQAARYGYSSTILASLTYGMYLVLAYQSIRLLYQRHRRQRGGQTGMLLYSLFMLAITTIWFCVGAKWSSVPFIDGAQDPELFATLQCSPLGIAKDVFATLLVLASDGLLVWRTWVVWEHNPAAVALPLLTYLSVLGTGVALNLMCADVHYGGTLHFTLSQSVSVPTAFWSLSVSLNVLTTLLVAFKLLSHRREMLRLNVLGAHDSVREYASVVGILAESAALYALLGLIYIPLFVHNVPVGDPFSTLFAAASYLCPALIQLRVAQGVAYTSTRGSSRDTGRTLTEMRFEKDTEAQAQSGSFGRSLGSDTMRGTATGTGGTVDGDKVSEKTGGGSAEALPTVHTR